jgi:hypothetical protein
MEVSRLERLKVQLNAKPRDLSVEMIDRATFPAKKK